MSKNVPPQIEKYVKGVDDFMIRYPTLTFYAKLKEVEDQSGYHKVYFFLATVFLLFIVCMSVGGMKLIVDIAGFAYPAYMSFKSMDAGSKDDTQWLTYWVVFSFFNITESIFSFVRYIIPFYYWLKFAFILWMYHPSMRGAEMTYTQGLRPIFLPYLGQSGSKTE